MLLNFVVPRFAQIFSDPRMKIPLPTQIMLEASSMVQTYGLPCAIALVAALIALFRLIYGPRPARLWWDTLRLKIPLLGDALRKAETARFARAMATLVAASVPLVQSIGISRGILNNRRLPDRSKRVAQGVKRGEGIAGPLREGRGVSAAREPSVERRRRNRPPGRHVHRMADIYETETRSAIRRFTSLFEPLIILVMGLLVGTLILSMMLAITSINDVAG